MRARCSKGESFKRRWQIANFQLPTFNVQRMNPQRWVCWRGRAHRRREGISRGCWKSRVVPLGDGDEKDAREHCCVDVVGALPRCMDLITVADVIRSIEIYFEGGAVSYLMPSQREAVAATAVSAR